MNRADSALEPESRKLREHWLDRPEAGSRFAIRLVSSIGLHLGRVCTRLLLYPITLYFYFRRGPERRAARDYFLHLDGKPGSPWQVMRLIHAFAAVTLDRVFLLARGTGGFRVDLRGVDELCRHLDQGRGVLLLGAHVGSFEILRVLAADKSRCKLKLVMDKSKTPVLTAVLEALAPELSGSVIDTARGGMDIALELSDAAHDGAMITLLGDRGRPHESMRGARFLGADAPFPTAPWLIASLLKVPVVLCLGMYRGGNRYDLVFETLTERVELPRVDRNPALDSCIRHYAERLEFHLRKAPLNWFNFYDFWQRQTVVDAQQDVREDLQRARAS
ncbi:MAG: acyltransferase [Rhodanobacteraceae bacterium]